MGAQLSVRCSTLELERGWWKNKRSKPIAAPAVIGPAYEKAAADVPSDGLYAIHEDPRRS